MDVVSPGERGALGFLGSPEGISKERKFFDRWD
jgi:hypothetical protein